MRITDGPLYVPPKVTQPSDVVVTSSISDKSTSTSWNTLYHKTKKSSGSNSLLTDRQSPPATKMVSKNAGQKKDRLVVAFPSVIGKPEDRQRSRMRFVDRYLPPYDTVASYGRRSIPRRWR
jgi:hypothetical protein